MSLIIIILAYIFSSLSFVMSPIIFVKLKCPRGWYFIVPKTIIQALSPYWAILGGVGAILGVVYQVIEGTYDAIGTIPMGIISAILMVWYV